MCLHAEKEKVQQAGTQQPQADQNKGAGNAKHGGKELNGGNSDPPRSTSEAAGCSAASGEPCTEQQLSEPGPQAPEMMSEEEQQRKLGIAEALKAEGNALYAQQNYHAASDKYADAIEAGTGWHHASGVSARRGL